MYSIPQLLFFLCFFSLFFLIMIFGETPSGIYLMGLMSLLFLAYRKKNSFSLISKNQKFIAAFLLILGVAFISLFETTSFPFSLNKLILYLFSFACLIFFLTLKGNFFSLSVFSIGSVLLGSVLAVMAIGFLFYPPLGMYLNSMNMLVATYGHNHASVFFIFVIPLCFELWLRNKRLKISIFPLFIVTLALCLTFGRTAILIGLLEMVFLIWIYRKDLTQKIFIFLTASFLCVTLITLIVLSLLPNQSNLKVCQLSFSQFRLCKLFSQESRPQYWQQAFQAFIDKPLLGWGGGTYTIISNYYQENAFHFSAYAHNEYLQLLAEYGLVGGITFLFFLLLLIRRIFLELSSKNSKSSFLALSLLALLLDAFFDYDWNYLSIWLLLIIGSAFLFRIENVPVKVPFKKTVPGMIKIFFYLCISSVLLWNALFISSSILWWQGHYDWSQRIFPFIYWRVQEIAGTPRITPLTNKWLLTLYQSHSEVLRNYFNSETNDQKKAQLAQRLVQLQPYDLGTYSLLFQSFSQAQNWPELLETSKQMNQLYQKQAIKSWPEPQKRVFVYQLVSHANLLFLTNPDLATELYLQAYQVDPWVIHSQPFKLVFSPESYPKQTEAFLQQIGSDSNLWPYAQPLKAWYLGKMQNLVMIRNFEEAEDFAKKMMKLDAANRWQTWDVLAPLYHQLFENSLAAGNFMQAQADLDAWQRFMEVLDGPTEQEKVNFTFKKLLREDELILQKSIH